MPEVRLSTSGVLLRLPNPKAEHEVEEDPEREDLAESNDEEGE